MRRSVVIARLALAAGCAFFSTGGASARSLDLITRGGSLTLCAHPNALPYASKQGDLPGLQVEIAEVLASKLGVSLNRNWVMNAYQFRRAGCDIVLDAIGDKGALAEVGLRASRPYYHSGVVLAVRGDSSIASLADVKKGQKVGVQVGSIAAMRLSTSGTGTSPFMFEEDILDALQNGEIDAAAVTPAAIGWFNFKHQNTPLRQIATFDGDADLNWNVAVGMISPDDKLREGIDAALDTMIADGTLSHLYERYGMTFRPPK